MSVVAKSIGLKINIDKTKAMKIGSTQSDEKLLISGREVIYVEEF